jgi:hypothetical protein
MGRDDILPGYHAIDINTPIGALPYTQCQELREQCGDVATLPPGVQNEYAWVGLEAALAMVHETNPQTGKPFTPKEINIATEQAKTEFRGVFTNTNAPMSIRAGAGLALASAGMYQESAQGTRAKIVSKNHLPYLRGIQKVARELLAHPDPSAKEAAIMNAAVSLAMLTEYALEQGWFLPASPRQSWQINGINRRGGQTARIVVADEAPAEGIIAIHRDALGDELWDRDETWRPFTTLAHYANYDAGFATRSPQKARLEILIFKEVSDRHFYYLNEQSPAAAQATKATLGNVALAEEPERRSEVGWFVAQSAFDLRDIVQTSFTINLRNMEIAQASGELSGAEQHVLGWMQLDYARMLTVQAEAAEEQARQNMSDAWEHFSGAHSTLSAAAKAMPPEQAGEMYEILLDAEAAPVYRELFTGADPEQMAAATDAYLRRLAALQPRMRLSEQQLKRDPNQLDILRSAALRTIFCLLLSGSTDEAARHLALTHSVRAGGSRGEMDAVVFPIDYANGGYETGSPVTVQIQPGKEVTVSARHITIGMDLLAPPGQPLLGMLTKLAAVVRATKPGSRKKDTRGANIDALTLRLGDAIADAAEQ